MTQKQEVLGDVLAEGVGVGEAEDRTHSWGSARHASGSLILAGANHLLYRCLNAKETLQVVTREEH